MKIFDVKTIKKIVNELSNYRGETFSLNHIEF